MINFTNFELTFVTAEHSINLIALTLLANDSPSVFVTLDSFSLTLLFLISKSSKSSFCLISIFVATSIIGEDLLIFLIVETLFELQN